MKQLTAILAAASLLAAENGQRCYQAGQALAQLEVGSGQGVGYAEQKYHANALGICTVQAARRSRRSRSYSRLGYSRVERKRRVASPETAIQVGPR